MSYLKKNPNETSTLETSKDAQEEINHDQTWDELLAPERNHTTRTHQILKGRSKKLFS